VLIVAVVENDLMNVYAYNEEEEEDEKLE